MRIAPWARAGLIGVAVAGMFAGGSALTASNTVDATKAGIGTAGISGFTATNIHYNLNATDPTTIDSVDLTLNSAPVTGSTAEIQLASGGGWYSCTGIDGTSMNLSCATTGELVADATDLTVIVAQ